MIYAVLQYDQHYSDVHDSLVELLTSSFRNIEHGHQGDSWIWIFENEEKVAIDTFSSMKHEVKSEVPSSTLAKKVIETLSRKYQVVIHPEPKIEPDDEL